VRVVGCRVDLRGAHRRPEPEGGTPVGAKARAKKQHDVEKVRVLESFATYAKRRSELGRLKAKHAALLSARAAESASKGSDVGKALDKELDRQRGELVKANGELTDAYLAHHRRRREARPQIVGPFEHGAYQKYPYAIGSYKLLRPDQLKSGGREEEDFGTCTTPGAPKQLWKIGWYYLYDDKILNDPPEPGVHFTIVPFPLRVNEPMPLDTSERPWLDTYYAIDGPVGSELRIGVHGGNGSAWATVAYGIDIGQSYCAMEFRARSEVYGYVDVGAYASGYSVPRVDFVLNIDVYQFRCLGAPISEVDLNGAVAYRSWRVFPPAEEAWGNPDTYSDDQPGLHYVPSFEASVSAKFKDIEAGDSFLFVYHGSVFAPESGVQLEEWRGGTMQGTMIFRQPTLFGYFRPCPPSDDNLVQFTGF